MKQFKLMAPDGEIIMQGSLNAVMQHVIDSKARKEAEALIARADQAAEQEREREQRERELVSDGIRVLADGFKKLDRRFDALMRSRDARRKLDAASEATKQMLELPKDAPELDLSDDTPSPSGELRPLEAKDPKEHQPAASDQGDLPKELLKGAPPEGLANYPTLDQPPRKQVSQPVAISLNKEC
jgi:hypothetical protein